MPVQVWFGCALVEGMESSAHPKLVIQPLTPSLWPALADLLDQGGPAGRCWCVAPMGIDYRQRPVDNNRADFQNVVKQGPPPGLLALSDKLAVGWCRVTPREAVPGLERSFRTRHVDDLPVWSISCFYIRKGHRRKGIMTALISSAIEFAHAAGAPALEAYPLDGAVSPSATSTGYASTFARAGFVEIARRSPERPIMRIELGDSRK
jgi:GNAT superfamily N-acetyltransferase